MPSVQEADSPAGLRWFTAGDLNGFFGLMVDNMTVLALMASILIGFGFPAEFIYTKMFPGTALGVLFGDLVYTYLGYRLAKRTGNPNVTAMPLGLDTPSSIAMVFTVLVPAFLGFKAKYPDLNEAALHTWYVGMATMVNVGLFKLVFSFAGPWLQRAIPLAGLLGSLAGIGLALIGVIPVMEIFKYPVVGLIALGIVFYTLVAGIKLPKGLPGVAVAVLIGTVIHYLLPAAGLPGGHFSEIHPSFQGGLPIPTFSWTQEYVASFAYLPVALPFAILTVIGGVNVTESARVGGDDYNTREILLTEAVATLLAGICGGVAQSTPYIGQPAYKAMGARLGYTIYTGVFIGLGGMLGFVSVILQVIPTSVLAPILVFVALDIVAQAFLACKPRHAAAVAWAHVPSVARLVAIQTLTLVGDVKAFDKMPGLLAARENGELSQWQIFFALGNGFILSAMLWGAFLAELIDRRVRRSAIYLLILAGLTWFGIIHASNTDGRMYNPLHLPPAEAMVPKLFTLGYLGLAVLFFALSFTKESQEPVDETVPAGHFA